MSIKSAYTQQIALIGSQVGLSDWLTIDQSMINAFADATQDQQFIHTDPHRAATETPFGGTIAHGFLTLSLASKLVMDTFTDLPGQSMSINYGFDRLRFVSPVKSGSSIRARFVLDNVIQKSDTHLLKHMTMTMEIKGRDAPALVANWLWMLVFDKTKDTA